MRRLSLPLALAVILLGVLPNSVLTTILDPVRELRQPVSQVGGIGSAVESGTGFQPVRAIAENENTPHGLQTRATGS